MIVKNLVQKNQYRDACKISTEIHRKLYDSITIGLYPVELDELAGRMCKKMGVKSSFKGVEGYHHNACIFVNDVAVHGIPSSRIAFEKGDLVTIDFGIIYKGLHTDHCQTVGIKEVSDADMKLMKEAREAIWKGLHAVKAGGRVGDVGEAMAKHLKVNGLDSLKEYTGHSIGKTLWDEPHIPTYGSRGQGKMLKKNMVVCVEAQVVSGTDEVKIDDDKWTVRTKDGKNSAMYEFMAFVEDDGIELLTPTYDWELVK